MTIIELASFVDKDLTIQYSQYTNKFYVNIESLEIKGDGILIGVAEHAETPKQALIDFCEKISNKTIVIDTLKDRMEYKLKNIEYKETK